MSDNKKTTRKVLDIASGREIEIDVDTSLLLTDEDEKKRTITYTRKVKPYIDKIQEWRAEGKGANEIAHILNINVGTLYEYKRNYPELDKAWELGNERLADSLETSLYKSAKGYEYEEEALTKAGYAVKLKKYAHPNIAASKFALSNIRPEKWRAKPVIDSKTGTSTKAVEALNQLSVEQIQQFLELRKKLVENNNE